MLFTVFSYGLTAPNLLLLPFDSFVAFQLTMWQLLFEQRDLLTFIFLTLQVVFFCWYLFCIWSSKFFSFFKLLSLLVVLVLLLALSSVALSYDVFNYIFNAKMVVEYQVDPHTLTALDFPDDDWSRFMHNVHTSAPYGYGWTALSLLPFILGYSILNSFFATLLSFRLLMIIALFSTFLIMHKMIALNRQFKSILSRNLDDAKKRSILKSQNMFLLSLLMLNPLFLIETVSSVHNDIWMMLPAIVSFYFLLMSASILNNAKAPISKIYTLLSYLCIIVSALFLLFSISIKLATVLLIPLWIILLFVILSSYVRSFWLTKPIITFWPVVASILLFIPLLTERSKWFLPWYIIWSLVWIPLFSFSSTISRMWASIIISFSFSALLRYVPFMWYGGYQDPVFTLQLFFTWIGALILFPGVYFFLTYTYNRIDRNTEDK